MGNSTFQKLSTIVLGAGSVGLALWALARPRSFGEMMGVSPRHASALGVRDLGIGLGILAGQRAAYGLRAAADITDAVTVAGVRPRVSAGAALFAAWAVAAGLSAGAVGHGAR
jgi:hypothetical protein